MIIFFMLNNEVEREVSEFERSESDHTAAFVLHKRISCFAHCLQLIVRKFDTVKSPRQTIAVAHKLVSKVCKSVQATERLVSLSGLKLVLVFLMFLLGGIPCLF